MIIDISKLNTGLVSSIDIDSNIDTNLFDPKESRIKDFNNLHLNGNITIDIEDNYELRGTLTGDLILEDDITLDSINYPINIEIDEVISTNNEENIKNNQNTLDIIDILWQNIVVEVPIKVTNNNIDELSLKGDGWKVISENTYEELNTTSLGELLDSARKE